MRKASFDYCLWMVDDKFVGVSLGHDYCAEHEWGIREMKGLFGIPESTKKNMGIKCRIITECPRSLMFKEETFKKQKCAILFTQSRSWLKDVELETLPSELEHYKKDIECSIKWEKEHPPSTREPKDPILCAWDSYGFGVAVMGEKEVGYLKELYEAFKNLNVAITYINLMPKNPFSNASLSLLIKDRLPQEVSDRMYSADKCQFDLKDYEKKIGLTKIKEKYHNRQEGAKYYMACSAHWIDYDDKEAREKRKGELKTKYDIWYWVNYSDDDNNYGWYTAEEIKEWLTGKKRLVEIRKAS